LVGGGWGGGCAPSFWRLPKRLHLVVVGRAATVLVSPGKACCTHIGAFRRRGWWWWWRGGFVFSRSPSFPALTPSIFPRTLFLQSLWFSNEPAASSASLQVLLFQHLNQKPSSLSLLTSFCPHFSSPSLSLRWSCLVGEDSWQDASLLPWQQEPSLSLRSP